ncbi:hypothetical protein QUB70_14620 [Microcoleus sp. A003_D6]
MFPKLPIALRWRWQSLKIQLPAADSELFTALWLLSCYAFKIVL